MKNPEQTSLKYPVILVHGIMAHDRKGIIDYWGRIPKVLRENNVIVYLGNTDAWGSYESNAEILKNTIDNVLSETGSEKVNLIAHSKGGIDSRYMIWNYNYADKIASLTTISTPHRGAEIADLIYSQKIINTKIFRKSIEIYEKLHRDQNPDLYSVNYQLTTYNMEEFNKKIVMDDRVYFQSLYTTLHSPMDDTMFYYSYKYIKKISGANDGIVSELSASWGNNIKKIGNRISHAEIIDYKKLKIYGVNIPDIYLKIVRDLGKLGY